MSDPRDRVALKRADITHIVEASSTQSLIGASVMSSRVITEATVYLERIAKALEKIAARLDGKDERGQYKAVEVTADLHTNSVKSLSELTTKVQPQIDKHAEKLERLAETIAELATHVERLAGQRPKEGDDAAVSASPGGEVDAAAPASPGSD